MIRGFLYILCLCLFYFSCKEKEVLPEDPYIWKPLKVTATAYNSVSWQTSDNPHITAWGDSLVPGLKYIAVSRDLIKEGLDHNTMVKIDTFPDTFYVKDKMHYKWRNRIDIYMGLNRKKALKWGRRKVHILYAVKKDSLTDSIITP